MVFIQFCCKYLLIVLVLLQGSTEMQAQKDDTLFGIKGRLVDDKLSIRISVEDILYSYREKGKALVNVFDINYHNLYDTRYVLLAISYNLGKLQARGIKDRSLDGSEMGRIKSGK